MLSICFVTSQAAWAVPSLSFKLFNSSLPAALYFHFSPCDFRRRRNKRRATTKGWGLCFRAAIDRWEWPFSFPGALHGEGGMHACPAWASQHLFVPQFPPVGDHPVSAFSAAISRTRTRWWVPVKQPASPKAAIPREQERFCTAMGVVVGHTETQPGGVAMGCRWGASIRLFCLLLAE